MRLALALLTCLALTPAVTRAQGTARSMDLDPSVLSSGMGGASTAVWWSGEPNYWANPALLGYYRGLRWQTAHTDLVPDLASNVTFDTDRFTVGGGGLGFEFSGHPIDGLGGLDLHYGGGYATFAPPTGESYERIEASGWGVSLEQAIVSLMGFAGKSAPSWLRHADAAFGYSRKFTEVSLDPTVTASATTHDYGWLVKGGFGGHYTMNDDAGPISVDAGYGQAVLNYDDASFVFPPGPPGYPPSRQHRTGYTARLAFDNYGTRNSANSPVFSALMRGFAPLATLGFAYDQTHFSAGGSLPEYDVTQYGLEATIINVLTLRGGHVWDALGDIHDYSYGFGVAIPITEYAGARYDYAKYPEAQGLSRVSRNSFSVWFNPIALNRAIHSSP